MQTNEAEDKFASARRQMLEYDLKGRDIADPGVLKVMAEIRRQEFIPPSYRFQAYADGPLPIGCGQTISQPYIVALMTQALRVNQHCEVLEIGTGSGYQAAILAEICREVYTVERIPELAATARETLRSLRYSNVFIRTGDGCEGWPEHASYDGILVAAAASSVPQPLYDQLADRGRMIIPVGDWRTTQVLMIARRTGGAITTEESIGCRFVPLVGKGGFDRY